MYFNATFTYKISIFYFVQGFTVYIHELLTLSESLMMLSPQSGMTERASNFHLLLKMAEMKKVLWLVCSVTPSKIKIIIIQ